MNPPNYDPNEDRSGELSPSEVAELETTLRSFRPRQPRRPTEHAVQLQSPTPASRASRRVSPWTLGVTWFSGAIVGGLAVFLLGQTSAEPQPDLTSAPTVEVVQPQHDSPPNSLPIETTVIAATYQSETVERLFADSWLEANSLSASSHLAFQAIPKTKTKYTPSPIERELVPEVRPRRTQQQLLREILADPNDVL